MESRSSASCAAPAKPTALLEVLQDLMESPTCKSLTTVSSELRNSVILRTEARQDKLTTETCEPIVSGSCQTMKQILVTNICYESNLGSWHAAATQIWETRTAGGGRRVPCDGWAWPAPESRICGVVGTATAGGPEFADAVGHDCNQSNFLDDILDHVARPLVFSRNCRCTGAAC